MLSLQNITYIHPDRELLFDHLNFSIAAQQKASLVGDNGSGKSTLLRLIAGELTATQGLIKCQHSPYYIPQLFGQNQDANVGQVLEIQDKLDAFYAILNGEATEAHLLTLDDDWGIEERCLAALQHWGLTEITPSTPLADLSGGQKTKVFLAGIHVHRPHLIIMDEPSNHLDDQGRALLYQFIETTSATLLATSHDRALLRLLDSTYELRAGKIASYGGNYDYYRSQKDTEEGALQQQIHSKEKQLRKAKEKQRDTLERQQRIDARGKKKQENAGVARIMMNTLRNGAENSSSKLRSVHSEKTEGMSEELSQLRASRSAISKMRFAFTKSNLHSGKTLLEATLINACFHGQRLWSSKLSFALKSGERVLLSGKNGSGKTTLLQMLLGSRLPDEGTISRQPHTALYIDQDYSMLHDELSVYAMAQHLNDAKYLEHEVKTMLDQFLFAAPSWAKSCASLSGGERMRLCLCCLSLQSSAPDLIILDEPTNNLDIQNIEILTAAIKAYEGTLVVVSHDQAFIDDLQLERELRL